MGRTSEVPEEFRFRGRPTTYKGIKMRSRLEASFAQLLDSMGVTWKYEPRCYAGSTGQYLPDFLITENVFYRDAKTFAHFDGLIFVEVKPTCCNGDVEPIFSKMQVIWESEPGAALLVWVADAADLAGSLSLFLPTDPPDESPDWPPWFEAYVHFGPCSACGVATLNRWTWDGPCGVCADRMATA